jgi:hypothetical protein
MREKIKLGLLIVFGLLLFLLLAMLFWYPILKYGER